MSETLKDLIERDNVRITATYGAAPLLEDWPDAHPYGVTLRRKRRQMSTPFYMGSALTDEPTAEDVLESLLLEYQAGRQTFEDYCADYGYDVNSHKAHATWEACRKSGDELERFLGGDLETYLYAEA
jgi:hypothetical protein